MHMPNKTVETLELTIALSHFFLADCNGRVRVCMHIVALHIANLSIHLEQGVPSRHTYVKKGGPPTALIC